MLPSLDRPALSRPDGRVRRLPVAGCLLLAIAGLALLLAVPAVFVAGVPGPASLGLLPLVLVPVPGSIGVLMVSQPAGWLIGPGLGLALLALSVLSWMVLRRRRHDRPEGAARQVPEGG